MYSPSNPLTTHQIHIKNFKAKSLLSNNVEVIKKNSDVLMEIINNIMDLSKLELNIYESNKDYYNIVNLVEDTAVAFNDYIKLNDIEIFFDTDEDKERFECYIDIYKKDGKYYVEQRYNGIYEIPEEDFNLIKSYIK